MKMIMENWRAYAAQESIEEFIITEDEAHLFENLDLEALAEGKIGDMVDKAKGLIQSKIGDKILAAFIKAQAKGVKATGTLADFVNKHMPGLKDPKVVAALTVILAGGAAAIGSPTIAKAIATQGAMADLSGLQSELPELMAGLLAEVSGSDPTVEL